MREVRFILPYHRRGVKPDPGHRYVEDQLMALYGGFTARQVVGSWWHEGHRYDDTSIEYVVAVDETDDHHRVTVSNIAIYGGALNEQISVYFVHTDGDVELLDCSGVVT